MRALDFYEFVGILIPGSTVMVSPGYLLNLTVLDTILLPVTFGGLGVHLMLAYVIGHLLQAVGNGLETLYWACWKGMPTDWPVTRHRGSPLKIVTEVRDFCNPVHAREDSITAAHWRSLVAQVRSTVYSSNRAARLHVFNGTNGMFRGLLVAELIIGIAGFWISQVNAWAFCPVLLVIMLLTVYRIVLPAPK